MIMNQITPPTQKSKASSTLEELKKIMNITPDSEKNKKTRRVIGTRSNTVMNENQVGYGMNQEDNGRNKPGKKYLSTIRKTKI